MQVSFKQLIDPEFKRDPLPLLRTLRENGPLVDCKIPVLGKIRFATTYSAVDQLLRDRDRFVLEPQHAGRGRLGDIRTWLPGPIRVLTENMLQKDEPDHRRLRSFAELAFLRKNIDSMRDRITMLADSLIDDFADEPSIDLMSRYSRSLPLAVICELLGLPLEDRSQFSRWIKGVSNASLPWGLVTMLPGIWKLNRYLKQRFRIERQRPSGGLISELVAAEQDGSKLSENELLSMVFLLFIAGHETTTHLMTLSMMTLLTRVELRQQWMNDPEGRLRAVDELLRFLSPVQMTKPRYAASDTQIDGVPVQQGQMMMGLLAAANLDPCKFDHCETIDFARHPNQHLGFGGGIHFCLGAQLARIETEIGITRLLERFPDLEMGCDESQLRWTGKTGMRTLFEFPVRTA
ncbi:MAG: cytochrome P450 [Pirellulaceae bacterium]|nr:cytochrome P450 [Pirellulaceae bacterium]